MGLLAAKKSKAELYSPVRPLQRQPREFLATGIPSVDQLVGGFPRGAISEIIGPESSGRTTLLYRLLQAATSNREICAYVDLADSFDPRTASWAGVALPQLLWVRCHNNLEHALKAVDYLLHGGGFGVVALDIGRRRREQRLASSYWYRFRQPIEHTSTILVVIASETLARQCAALRLEMRAVRPRWQGPSNALLLRGARIEAIPQKPFIAGSTARIEAQALTLGD
jgi:recombination protein RecA